MKSKDALLSAVKAALIVGAAGSALPMSSALGQAAPSAVSSATPESINLSKVVVTGSRIPQTAVATAQPVVRINRQEINASGLQTVGQLLQDLTAAGPSVNMTYNNTENGVETINLHDLGAKRVLVLVNGQRWASPLNGIVDLTSIPLSAVNHVEILLDGASSVYGSEAIAGVINIITIKNFNGAKARAYFGIYDAKNDGGGWDGKVKKYSFTVGTAGQRSSVLLSAGYYKQYPVFAGNRTLSKEPIYGYGVQNGFPPAGGRFVVLNLTGASNLPNGCSSSNVVCDVAGANANDPSGFHAYTPADNYNSAPDEYLLTPSERWYVYSQGHYNLTNDVSFHFMTTYRHRSSSRRLFPFPMLLGIQGSQRQNGMRIGVAKGAPGNPFGVDLVPYYPGTSGFSKWCQLYGSSTCMSKFDVAVALVKSPRDLGIFTIDQGVDTLYFNGGFNGYFMFAGNQWQWNVDYIYSRYDVSESALGRNMVKFQKALSQECSSNPNCKPINIFGAGNISHEAAEYVNYKSISTRSKVLRDYNASISGRFFNDWYAGSWGIALGYEYEGVQGSYQPSAITVAGNSATGKKKPTEGFKNTNAQFVELQIPLAKDLFLAKDISLDLAQRYSQFHWEGIGNVFNPQSGTVSTRHVSEYSHSETPRVTLKWAPIEDLLLRATWSQGFRSPSISELFAGTTGANFISINDPCNLDSSTTPRSDLPLGCNGNFHVAPTNNLVQNVTGGNSRLQPEKSITRTIGFVLSPSAIPNLNLSADFYQTEVTGVIRPPDPQFLVNDCFVNGDPTSCTHVDTSGHGDNTAITKLITLNRNVGSMRVEGWDFRINYRFPTTSVGQFQATLSGNFTRSVVMCKTGVCQDVAGTAGPTVTGVGGQAYPKHKLNFALNWAYGPWSANYNISLIGPMWENCALSLANGEGRTAQDTAAGNFDNSFCSNITTLNPDGSIKTGLNHIGTTIYHDIQASYTLKAWNTTFTLGVQNIFDKKPPIARVGGTFNFYHAVHRLPGRFIYGRVMVRF